MGGGGGGRGGFPGTGRAGLLRLFIPPLSKEVSWLLPFGLFGGVLLIVGAVGLWRLHERRPWLAIGLLVCITPEREHL